MKTATLGRAALASLAVLLLAGSAWVSVRASDSAPLPLSFTVPLNMGSVQDLGDQTYAVKGGQVVTAAVGGQTLDPGSTLTFSLDARSADLKVRGSATFDLEGTASGVPVSARGFVQISTDLTVAQVVKSQPGPCRGESAVRCSELPVLFGGVSELKITTGGDTKKDLTVFQVENPYFNPFGAPIIMASVDQEVSIVATYDSGTIQWNGSMISGPMTGVLGTSTGVSGKLSLVSTEVEDLVGGTAVDSGTISFSSMSPSFLDMSGSYTGTSFIPAPGPGSDCSGLFGFPVGSGVCTTTGFDSMGQYTMGQEQTEVVGTYSTVWTAPAVAFTSTSSATVTFHSDE